MLTRRRISDEVIYPGNVLRAILSFAPFAALLTVTPGAATAMIVRSAARGGRRHAFFTTAGNSLGVLTWGMLAAAGIAAVVATSTEVFTAVKLAGAAVLIVMGALSLRGRPSNSSAAKANAPDRPPATDLSAVRDGLLTSIANPKLAVFFVALFPQFVPRGDPVLPAALAMAALIVSFDLVWYSALAFAVSRAKHAFLDGPWGQRAERLTGAVLVGLGVRLALERR
jgi:threonine/homoserine/homoserine lactone efflux protein